MARLTIGLPVYNGERYLREAVDSILGQTFTDFELIISDNCSSDGTERICREYASKDARIRYIRQEKNLGAAPNFNFVVHEATGEFFKWAAHDDIMAPVCVERCIAVLDSDPDVVLCYTRVKFIDEKGAPSEVYDSGLSFDQLSAHERFGEQLKPHRCHEIFGVIRTPHLKKTALIGSYSHGDGVLLAHLALMGKISCVPEALFFNREHDEQSRKMLLDRASYSEWFDIANRGRVLLPYWKIYFEYFKLVLLQPMSVKSRFWCFLYFLREIWRHKRPIARDIKLAARQIRNRRQATMVRSA